MNKLQKVDRGGQKMVIQQMEEFRSTSSTTLIFNVSRILWTNFKKLTEVDKNESIQIHEL